MLRTRAGAVKREERRNERGVVREARWGGGCEWTAEVGGLGDVEVKV